MKIIGKNINQFAAQRNDLPGYFNESYSTPEIGDWHKRKRVNGEFIAKKYNAILSIIEETKAKVLIRKDAIFIKYSSGQIKIKRDILTDNFLVPVLRN